jgi:hypothetical protein
MLANFWAGNLKEINYWGGTGVVGQIVLKSVLEKCGLGVWNMLKYL